MEQAEAVLNARKQEQELAEIDQMYLTIQEQMKKVKVFGGLYQDDTGGGEQKEDE